MNRRQYLSVGTTAFALAVAGCMDTGETQQFPPYPDSESTEFDGEGDTTTDSFELVNDGPMILDVQHEGDDRFVAFAVDDEDQEFVQGGPTIQAAGPYRGSSIHSLENDRYRLEVEASGEWTATVYDLPAYEDGVGLHTPIEHEGALGSVIGPIDFGEAATRQFHIEFQEASEANIVELFNREGEFAGTLFDPETTAETDSADETAETTETETRQSIEVSGVGYLSIRSGVEWTVSVREQS